MPAYNFQKQFVSMILEGKKPHTIRKRRKHPTKVGDVLKLFTGMRTKNCKQFAEAVCVKVEPLILHPWIGHIRKDGLLMEENEIVELSKADGFDSPEKFFAFFRDTYKLFDLEDFELIHWDPQTLKVVSEMPKATPPLTPPHRERADGEGEVVGDE